MCPQARAAYLRQTKRSRVRSELEGPLRIDVTGSRRRVRALQAAGWPLRDLASRLGLQSVGGLGSVLSRSSTVHVDTAARISALYDALSCEDGPDLRSTRAAERGGWPPPWAWHGLDIDDPDVWPARPDQRRFWDAARWSDYDHLQDAGVPLPEIATRFGIGLDALRKAVRRGRAPDSDRPAATHTDEHPAPGVSHQGRGVRAV